MLALIGITAGAKAASGEAAKDLFRGNAKFNVVSVVLGIIFAGIAVFLFRLDKRVSDLEKEKEKEA